MQNNLKIEVAALDAEHRRALEEVIGCQLAKNQQVLISVVDEEAPAATAEQPAQSLDDWTRVYDGLSDEQIEAIDRVAKTRANLTRDLT